MGERRNQETIHRLKQQLGVDADAAAKAFAQVLHTFCDLLAESMRQEAPKPRSAETGHVAELLSSEEAAAYLGVTKSTLATWRCIARRAIPYVKVGRKVRYRKSDLDSFMKQRTATHSGEADLL